MLQRLEAVQLKLLVYELLVNPSLRHPLALATGEIRELQEQFGKSGARRSTTIVQTSESSRGSKAADRPSLV